VPIVAMVPFLCCFGPRPSRPRWLSTRPGTIGPHLAEAEMQWRAAIGDFVSGRGMTAQPAGVRKSTAAVAGGRSRRSRSPIRHASSSPREGRPASDRKGTAIWPRPRRRLHIRQRLTLKRSARRLSTDARPSAPSPRPGQHVALFSVAERARAPAISEAELALGSRAGLCVGPGFPPRPTCHRH